MIAEECRDFGRFGVFILFFLLHLTHEAADLFRQENQK